MKISKFLFAFIGCQTTSDALPLSDELKALSNFDSWADSVTSSVPFGKEPRTEDAAGRLRGIRADLFQLLNGLPDSYFEQSNNNEDEGSASGDYQYDSQLDNKDDDTVELVFDTSTGTFDDVALLVRNGALDESLLKSHLNANQATLEDGNEQDSRGHGLFEKESNDAEPVYDMPSFEKYMAGRRQEPRIINGQNKSNNSWLGYSLLGSIGAIFVTVSATVCVRRVKSKKDQTSGTPIQKLKRYQGHQINQSQQNRPGRSLNHVNFTGYNPAFRPQYFNPNQSVNGGFSSAMSTLSSGGSGFGMQNQMPKQPVVQQHFQPNPNLARAMSMSSGYTSENRSNAPLTQGPQDRALPPPPYAKVQY